MKAIILAAGRGSRMGDETKDKPKCLTKINGAALIEHQIDALTQAGMEDIAIVTGYKSELLEAYGTKHFHNPDWSKSNMVASLLSASSWLNQYDCIISYSDIFYDPQIIRELISCAASFAIAYDVHWFELWSKRFQNPLLDAESFSLDEHHYLTDIGKKNPKLCEIQGQYMGLLKIKKGLFNELISSLDIDTTTIDMTSFISLIIKQQAILCIPNTLPWGEVDSLDDLVLYRCSS